MKRCQRYHNYGFTLVELSVVLVIIGLLIGSILVGKDLIYQSSIRAQLKQVDQLEIAYNTFFVKYNCLPGDCTTATQLFGTTDSKGYTIQNGDGDGIIKSSHGNLTTYGAGECIRADIADEVSQLPLHLNDSGLGNYAANGNSANVQYANIGREYPYSDFGNNTGIYITCLADANNLVPSFLRTGNVMVIGAGTGGAGGAGGGRIYYTTGTLGVWTYGVFGADWLRTTVNSQNAGLPLDAIRQMDSKIDDGNPNKGKFGVISGTVACGGNNVTSYTDSTSACKATGGKKI